MKFLSPTLTLIIVIVTTLLACNLASDAPPTLAPRTPRSTLTPANPFGPQSTILPPPVTSAPLPQGYTTLLPSDTSIADIINQVDASLMMSHVQTLVGFNNRYSLYEPLPTQGIAAARDWLVRELEAIQAANPATEMQILTQPFDVTYGEESWQNHNVAMIINGLDGEAGVVLLGAHYDTISTTNDLFQPGANDNGSGVAAALQISRIMAQQPHRAVVVIIFFAAEEVFGGRYGSVEFAETYIQAQHIPLVAAINLDMIGNPTGPTGERHDFQMRTFSEPPNNSASRQLARLTEVVARIYVPSMTVNVINALDRQGRWGDHESFSEIGYPAIRLIEQQDDPRFAHNSQDTISTIDPDYLTRTTQVTLATLHVLADGPNPPTVRQMDSSTWTLEWSPVTNAASYVVALRSPGSLAYNVEIPVSDTRMSWVHFPDFEAVAVAAVDADGLIGRFSPEQSVESGPFE
jgi:leucyl aminopeptidase